MADIFDKVFDSAAICALLAVEHKSEELSFRLEVIQAHGPFPQDRELICKLAWLRARKACWSAYLDAAMKCGLLDGDNGRDIVQRLTGTDDDNFRSAMAECMTCWHFAYIQRLKIAPKPPGRDRRVLEMTVHLTDGPVCVEVKAPKYGGKGLSFKTIGDKLAEANKQFSESDRNLLVITPTLPIPIYGFRLQAIKPLLGEFGISWPVNEKFEPMAEPKNTFFPNGKFLRPIKPDRSPGHTRIAGMFSIEESIHVKEDGRRPVYEIRHQSLLVHNPMSPRRLPSDCWIGTPQFLDKGDYMSWTDGHSAMH